MSFLVLLWYYLWIVPHILLVVILFQFLRRRLYRQFPIFLAYIGFEVLQFAVLFTIQLMSSVTAKQYAVTYTFGLAISTALHFGVIYEISAYLFRNYSTLSYFGRPLFRWITVSLLLTSLLLAVSAGVRDIPRLLSTMYVMDRTAGILQCGLLILIFALSSYLNLSWRSYVFGIALGLGIFSSIELAASAIRSQIGSAHSHLLDYLIMGTYHCCVLIWGFYLWAPERSSQYTLTIPETDLESWNQELQRLIKQ
jgi:hypothetical protein